MAEWGRDIGDPDRPRRVKDERAIPDFDPAADLTPLIRAALAKPNPRSALAAAFPWVPMPARLQLVMRARTARGPDRTLLVERYQHAVRAEWADRYMDGDPAPRWVRLRRALGWPWTGVWR